MKHLQPTDTTAIISALRSGQVVALPTETVYGLAISLHSPSALEKLIYLKKRDIHSGKVFTLVPESRESIEKYAQLDKFAKKLIHDYVPGELTLILRKKEEFHHPYFDHFETIGIRIPHHPLFQQILPTIGPLLLTSANPRGATPATTSAILEQTMPKVDVVVDGTSGCHSPSTIISLVNNTPELIRQGDLIINLTQKRSTHARQINPK